MGGSVSRNIFVCMSVHVTGKICLLLNIYLFLPKEHIFLFLTFIKNLDIFISHEVINPLICLNTPQCIIVFVTLFGFL